MPIALSEEHEALRQTAERWFAEHCPPSVPRSQLDAEHETLAPAWTKMLAQGWLGLHVPESLGGEGYGLAELAVVLEAAGAAVMPGPLLGTVAAAAILSEGLPDAKAELKA